MSFIIKIANISQLPESFNSTLQHLICTDLRVTQIQCGVAQTTPVHHQDQKSDEDGGSGLYSVCKRPVERLTEFKLLSLHMDDDLLWKICTKAAGWEAQQGLHFLWFLGNSQLTEELLFFATIYIICWFSMKHGRIKSLSSTVFFQILFNRYKKKRCKSSQQ